MDTPSTTSQQAYHALLGDPNTTLGAPADHATAWHEHIEWETEAARWDGYNTALQDVAERHVELADAWARATGRTAHQQKIAGRVAEMAAHAAAGHAERGTAEWVGLDNGAVPPPADWGRTADNTNARTLHAVPHRQEAA